MIVVESISDTLLETSKTMKNDMPAFLKDDFNVRDIKKLENKSLKNMPDFFDSLEEFGTGLPVLTQRLKDISDKNDQSIWKETKNYDKDGLLKYISWENAEGQSQKAYFKDGKLDKIREYNGNGIITNTFFDDKNMPYKQVVKNINGQRGTVSECVRPEVTINKGNFMAITDSLGRTTSATMRDIAIKPLGSNREFLDVHRDTSYLPNDHRGHLIADSLGGPPSKENVVAQNQFINQSTMARFENYVKDLKNSSPNSKIDISVFPQYEGNSMRPSAFSFEVIKDDIKIKLPDEFKNVENIVPSKNLALPELSNVSKYAGPIVAIGAFAYSFKDDVSKFIDGKSNGKEFMYDVGNKGTKFVAGSVAAAEGMAQGAAVGTAFGGPVGTVVGGIAGAVIGGVTGEKVAGKAYEIIMPEVERKG